MADYFEIERCPKCKVAFPEHTGYAGGGGDIITTFCICKKCGHRFKSIGNLKTGETTYE